MPQPKPEPVPPSGAASVAFGISEALLPEPNPLHTSPAAACSDGVPDERPDVPVEGSACDPVVGDALGDANDGVVLPPVGATEPPNTSRPASS